MTEIIIELEANMVLAYKELAKKLGRENISQAEFCRYARYSDYTFRKQIKMTFNQFKEKHGFPCTIRNFEGKRYKVKTQSKESQPFKMVKLSRRDLGEKEFKCYDLCKYGRA